MSTRILGRLPASEETSRAWILRKEVIQPQVLLQLPCYDFTPIADHTMGSCLPKGWPTDFRYSRLS